MFDIWFFLTPLAALADWAAQYREMPKIRFATKPLVLVLLILWFIGQGGWQSAGFLFGLALIFSLLGDVFLLDGLIRYHPAFFKAGLASFLLAQVVYIAAYNQGGLPTRPVNWLILLLVLAISIPNGGRVLLTIRRKPKEKPLLFPIIVYVLGLSLMLFSALSTLTRPDWSLLPAIFVSLGSVLFYISDSVLANDRFVKPIHMGKMVVIITYHTGQLLMITGVLLQHEAF